MGPALPLVLALLGAHAGGAYALREGDRAKTRNAFSSALGEQGAVDPLDVSGGTPARGPGTGLRGAFAEDPINSAILEAMGQLAGTPGVNGATLMQGLGMLSQRATSRGNLSESIAAERDRMLSGQGFNAEQQAREFVQRSQEAALGRAPAWARLAFDERQAKREAAAGPKLPASLTMYPQPGGGQITGPLPGTAEFSKGMESIVDGAQFIETVDSLAESYLQAGRGREYVGMSGGEQAALYGNIRGRVAKAEGSGVLQEGEYQRFIDTYPSPQALFDKLKTGDEYLLGTVKGWRTQAVQAYTKARTANPWAGAGDPPAAPTAESVAAKLRGTPADPQVRARLRRVQTNPQLERSGRIKY